MNEAAIRHVWDITTIEFIEILFSYMSFTIDENMVLYFSISHSIEQVRAVYPSKMVA